MDSRESVEKEAAFFSCVEEDEEGGDNSSGMSKKQEKMGEITPAANTTGTIAASVSNAIGETNVLFSNNTNNTSSSDEYDEDDDGSDNDDDDDDDHDVDEPGSSLNDMCLSPPKNVRNLKRNKNKNRSAKVKNSLLANFILSP